ncbi:MULTISPECIES: helix-turn-helix domain-containing protein [unclassified Pseudomonas]|uniref:helix-turn-helix domain-containing protein n=1 Tax=unclassified Pseudomonas TaxID=196821 RepID=UPI000B8793F7|nr:MULTISPECIES: helix-turn-helix domain-containing protein [unclassified Pseudomonas]
MRSKKSQTVLARLKQVTGTTTDASLSSALKISPQTLSSWKGRNSTPYALCVDIAQVHRISLDWLLLGEGPMQRPVHANDTEQPTSNTTREHAILSLWRLLNEEDRRAIQRALEEKHRLREIELQLAEMASLLSALKPINET